jgi:hypothetical protein
MAKNGRSFNYVRRSQDDVRARAIARGGNYDDFIKSQYKKYKVRDGKNVVRILPPTWEKAKHYGFDIFVNYGIGADNQAYLSLSKMRGEADPLAEAYREAQREDNEKVAKALAPRQRILMWVIDRQADEEGPQLWAAPFTFDKALANISMDEDTKEIVYIDDPDEGCDVRFHKEGSGLMTNYDASKMRLLKPSPLHEDATQAEEWLAYVTENPISECLQFYSYDHIAQVFNGHVRTDDDDSAGKTKASKRGLERRNTGDDEVEETQKTKTRPAPHQESAALAGRESDDDTEVAEPPKSTSVGASIRERLRQSRQQKPWDDD